MIWCFIGNFEAERICPAGGAASNCTSTDRPPGDETANNRKREPEPRQSHDHQWQQGSLTAPAGSSSMRMWTLSKNPVISVVVELIPHKR